MQLDNHMSDGEEKVSVGSAREPSTPKPQASGRSSPAGTVDADEVATASTVLVLEPSDRVADERTCYSFFAGDRLEEKNVLLVSLNSPADDCIDEFIEHDLPFPRNLGVISTEDQLQSTRTETVKSEAGHSVTVQTVSDPVDLPKLGMSISNVLNEWSDDEEVLVCFRSLTVLLQYVELQCVYRFVHVLTDRLASLDAQIHLHMDGEIHDEQTYATLRPLFDAVVEVIRL